MGQVSGQVIGSQNGKAGIGDQFVHAQVYLTVFGTPAVSDQ